jgi:hypothetical protein
MLNTGDASTPDRHDDRSIRPHCAGHKRETAERWLSKIALAPTGYGHFFVEHNRGHHVRVATPEDPASSRLGESYSWSSTPIRKRRGRNASLANRVTDPR